MTGFIKDYRSELDSDIWMMPPMYHRVWQFLKYKVNHSPNKIPMNDGRFFDIEPGQHLTSIRNIAKGVGYYEGLKWKEPNPRTISKILEWLEKQEMISIERGRGNRQYTLITLLNWALYQSKQEEGNSKTTVSTSEEQQSVHINKNDKECIKNEKEKDISSQIENLRQRYSDEQKKIIDNYLEMIRHTRTSARIADSVIHKMYQSWDKYPTICVEYGLKVHTDNVAYHSKKENYTLGIIRNTTADEAQQRLNKKKKNNVVQMYKSDSIDTPKELLGW